MLQVTGWQSELCSQLRGAWSNEIENQVKVAAQIIMDAHYKEGCSATTAVMDEWVSMLLI